MENGRTLIRWVLGQHADLLLNTERASLHAFLSLSDSAQALLLRLVMRTHDCFRLDSLDYPELPQPLPQALAELLDTGWLQPDPPLTVTDLARLLRRSEWWAMLRDRDPDLAIPGSTSKARMIAHLSEAVGETAAPLSSWWPQWDGQVVAIAEANLFERVRLMFFGNLYQDWSEFVITELGHQRYEPVALNQTSRAFQTRAEVNLYLALHACRRALDAADADLPALWQPLMQQPLPGQQNAARDQSSAWLARRRARVLHALGHRAEREGRIELALQAYREAWLPESRVRYFRVRERHHAPPDIWPDVLEAYRKAVSMEESVSLQRILKRLARKLGESPPVAPLQSPASQRLELEQPPAITVELAAAAVLSDDDNHCHYVENRLFTGLLALLCWPAIYAPIAGAFFHPFQAGPADLFREDFTQRRQAQLEACLAHLDDGTHGERILAIWEEKYGTACPLLAWPVLTQPILQQALTCIPAADLKAIFRHLLKDLRHHRRGLPDLIRFDCHNKTYELIEVKGPGDRLQDSQRQWLAFFATQGIPARVCHVQWPVSC